MQTLRQSRMQASGKITTDLLRQERKLFMVSGHDVRRDIKRMVAVQHRVGAGNRDIRNQPSIKDVAEVNEPAHPFIRTRRKLDQDVVVIGVIVDGSPAEGIAHHQHPIPVQVGESGDQVFPARVRIRQPVRLQHLHGPAQIPGQRTLQ